MGDLVVRHTQSEMIISLAAYLPGGELFESAFIPGTNFNALLAGLSGELLRAENFLFLYNSQFIPDQTTVFIEEWENALGIPDDCFTVSSGDTNEQRRINILVKMASLGVQTAEDFVNLATILGFSNVVVIPGLGADDDSIVNGTFDTDTDWTKGTGWTIFAGTANHQTAIGAGDLSQDITAVTGTLYVVTYDVLFTDTGTVTPNIGGTDGIVRSENGSYQEVIVAGASDTLFSMVADFAFNGSVDNIIVNGSLVAGSTPRFTIVVKFELETELFPLSFPIPFGDSALGIIECLFTKLKPANCDIVFENIFVPPIPVNSEFLAVAHVGSPFVTNYKRAGDVFTKLANPATLPTGVAEAVSFPGDAIYLAVGHNVSPNLTIYKRSGDVFTKLADPATVPPEAAKGVGFTPDGIYLAAAHGGSPFVTIYKRSGDVFTKLANPATLPTGNGQGASFTDDGIYLAVAHNNSPFVTIYKRSGDVFTKLANPATLPVGGGLGASFTGGGIYLAVAHGSSPFVTVYKRSGDVFTKLANPATLPTGAAQGAAF